MSQSQQKSQVTENQEETTCSQTEHADEQTQVQSSQLGSQKMSSQKLEEIETDQVSDYESQLSSVSTTGLTQSQSPTHVQQAISEGQTVPTPPSSQTSKQ